jgi:hypothetical protein
VRFSVFPQEEGTAAAVKSGNPENLQVVIEDLMQEISFYLLVELLNSSISSIYRCNSGKALAAKSITAILIQ